jgi:hypothetical protein
MVERAAPRLRRRTGSPELLAEEEMAFPASGVSGEKGKGGRGSGSAGGCSSSRWTAGSGAGTATARGAHAAAKL